MLIRRFAWRLHQDSRQKTDQRDLLSGYGLIAGGHQHSCRVVHLSVAQDVDTSVAEHLAALSLHAPYPVYPLWQ